MRLLLIGLGLAALASVLSLITGVQSFEADSRTGTVVEYWHGYERLCAIGYAIVFAAAAYAVYRRFPVAWKLGFVAIYLCAAAFVLQAWWYLWRQDYGWVGATAVTVFAPFIALYWASWWQRQRLYFFGDGHEQT